MESPVNANRIHSLKSLLHNPLTFDAFHKWLSLGSEIGTSPINLRRPDALELYFAILAFHKCVREFDKQTVPMAMALHRQFIRSILENDQNKAFPFKPSNRIMFIHSNFNPSGSVQGNLFNPKQSTSNHQFRHLQWMYSLCVEFSSPTTCAIHMFKGICRSPL